MFLDEVRRARRDVASSLCVGLDPHPDRMPERSAATAGGLRRFLRDVIEATAPYASLYKPNVAFYEERGPEGLAVLRDVIGSVHDVGRPVILDAKRGDIASTARSYARGAFDVLDADAITVVPYMGEDAVAPFLDRGRFVFLLALPSNPSAEAIVGHGSPPLYARVGALAVELERRYPEQVGLVVGATRPTQAWKLHELSPDLPWLVPGVGAQGGSLAALASGLASGHEAWVNVSRAILFDREPGAAAERWRREIGVWQRG